jgi:hypothetical protein
MNMLLKKKGEYFKSHEEEEMVQRNDRRIEGC